MFGGTGFGAALRPELAQAMRAETLKTGLTASLLNQLPKALAECGFPHAVIK
jgi:hypothetical protein